MLIPHILVTIQVNIKDLLVLFVMIISLSYYLDNNMVNSQRTMTLFLKINLVLQTFRHYD